MAPLSLLATLVFPGLVSSALARLKTAPLSSLPHDLRQLRRFRLLDWACRGLGLPVTRAPIIEVLTSATALDHDRLRALAELLGAAEVQDTASIRPIDGVTVFPARLSHPLPFRGRAVALVALDAAQPRRADVDAVRNALASALRELRQPLELPFVLLGGADLGDAVIPADHVALRLGERELRALLFSKSPSRTLAGLLHTRRLMALSPYATSGAVQHEGMFFGRAALVREMLTTSAFLQIVVGPRRGGKTSLLMALRRALSDGHPDVEPVFLDLLGVRDPQKAARTLARSLHTPSPDDPDSDAALVDVLRAWGRRGGKRAVLLIDEADGLIAADAAKGYPLLAAMRTLRDEVACSFVVAGYLHLHREALDHASPLYNLATVRFLGPLEPEAARDLAEEPMEQLGVDYADPALPARIAASTGGYPSFIQVFCDAVLAELRGGDLTITRTHVEAAEKCARLRSELGDTFRLNASATTQIAVYGLLNRNTFSRADAEQALVSALGRAPLAMVDRGILELRTSGFAVEQDSRFAWTIPLLRDTLLASEPELAQRRLVEELAEEADGDGKDG